MFTAISQCVVGASVSPLSKILFMLFVILSGGQYLYVHFSKKHRDLKKEEQQIEEIYGKDEDGFYPWERDTDDSPERVTEESKPYHNENLPRRSTRW